jgi:hypothetical protein
VGTVQEDWREDGQRGSAKETDDRVAGVQAPNYVMRWISFYFKLFNVMGSY